MTADAARAARYWAKVDIRGEDECWPWTAYLNPSGYGMFRGADGTRLAHRWAYAEFIADVAADQNICHRCDNPPCQNPRHLFLGTVAENSADKVTKGRQARNSQPGQKNPGAKLTPEDVGAIRAAYADGRTQAALAAAYGVGQTAISNIIRGKRWPGATAQDGSKRRATGTANTNAKLDEGAVRTIRATYAAGEATQAQLGAQFGVSQAVISSVVLRKIWRSA